MESILAKSLSIPEASTVCCRVVPLKPSSVQVILIKDNDQQKEDDADHVDGLLLAPVPYFFQARFIFMYQESTEAKRSAGTEMRVPAKPLSEEGSG